MKNAKKIVLLLLSLALLCGVFAVAALAEEPASTATVVYPDGSTVTVAVGETITPKEFTTEGEAKLFYGAGNTLFKATGDTWTFTVDGAALTDLTVTEAMAGKKIIATGVDKVYYTSKEIAVDNTSKVIYHLVSDVEKYFSTSNNGDRGDGTNTGASSYQDLRPYPAGTEGRNTIKEVVVVLYEDVDVASFTMNWFIDQASRGGSRSAYLDLNGHNVVNRTTSDYMEIKTLAMRLYSSKPGAHWYQPNSKTVFYVSDDATLYLGNNAENGEYARNLNVHVKQLFAGHYGSGAYIWGGNYYQAENTGAYLANVARRVSAVKHANFYVKDGVAVFGEASAYNGNTPLSNVVIEDCHFYSNGSSPVFLPAGQGKASLKFQDCTFNGVTAELKESEGTVTDVSGNTFDGAAVTYNTVTFADGTSDYYLASSLDEAKAFVESLPKATPAPYGKWVDGEYFAALNPISLITYDDNFNAVQTVEDGDRQLVYYTVETATGIRYATTNNLGSYLGWMDHGGATITMYQDTAFAAVTVLAKRVEVTAESKKVAEAAVYKLDLNGHKITATGSNSRFFDVKVSNFYVYSSVPGGVIDASNNTLLRSNNDDYKWINGAAYDSESAKYKESAYSGYPIIKPIAKVYLGEMGASASDYGKNLTVYCGRVNDDLYGASMTIFGGTYIQKGMNPGNKTYFLLTGREGGATSHFQYAKNATFVTTIANNSPLWLRASDLKSFTNCTFVSTNAAGVPLTNCTATSKTFSFENCNFVNVLPYYGAVSTTFDTPAYGTTSVFTVKDLNPAEDAAAYLAHGTAVKEITVAGETYVLDGTIITDPASALKLTIEDIGTEFWTVGTVPPKSAGDFIKYQDGKFLTGAYYNYEGISAIDADGKVVAAGEASVPIAYTTEIEVAFSYQIGDGEIQYVVSRGTPELDGALFVETLGHLSNLKIKMYSDIVLTQGVLFGTSSVGKTPGGADYDRIIVSGDVDWDLNGKTVTVAKGATPLRMGMYDDAGNHIFNCLHMLKKGSFKLYSSVEGGQYINNSGHAVFGIHKYTDEVSSYLLGTSDAAVNGGSNLKMISNATFTAAYEARANGPAGYVLTINGGTYVFSGTGAAFNLGCTASISNAVIVTTGSAQAAFINHWWALANFTINDSVVLAMDRTTTLIESGSYNEILTNGSDSKPHVLNVGNITYIGGTMKKALKKGTLINYNGKVRTDTLENLALFYAEAPEGKTLAYSSVMINGENYKYVDYYTNPTTVSVKNEVLNVTEDWLVGSKFVVSGDVTALNTTVIDGKLHYRPNPIWTYTVDGVVTNDPCAEANVGKTVCVNVGGETFAVIYSVDKDGVLTYYYDENAIDYFKALLEPSAATTQKVKLYQDIELSFSERKTIGRKDVRTYLYLDLNGRKLTINSTSDTRYALLFTTCDAYIYSSTPGGALDVKNAKGVLSTDGGSNVYFGEAKYNDRDVYGKNLTVTAKSLLYTRLWANNAHFIGGTYVQTEGEASDVFIAIDNGSVPTFSHCTFIIDQLNAGIIRRVAGTYTSCTFIAKNPTNLLVKYGSGSNSAVTFNKCYFYNVMPNRIDSATVTYTDCFFDKPYSIAQTGGYIAGTATDVSLTVNGETYKFYAKLLADNLLTAVKAGASETVYFETASFDDAFAVGKIVSVDWGFGLEKEYWLNDTVATHENETVEGAFIYAFEPIVLGNKNMTAHDYKIVGIVPGTIRMGLTVENLITFKLYIPKSAGFTEVVFGGIVKPLTEEEGDYYVVEATVSPSYAANDIFVAITGRYVHGFNTSLEGYASAVLADETKADTHNLVYAMVEYVELMAGTEFNVAAPIGYAFNELVGVKSANAKDGSLAMFALLHDNDVCFALTGTAGKKVKLRLADGMTTQEYTIRANGVSIAVPGVYELAKAFTFTANGEEEYTYSLANYLYELEAAEVVDAAVVAKLKGLYNYAYYANLYVEAQRA